MSTLKSLCALTAAVACLSAQAQDPAAPPDVKRAAAPPAAARPAALEPTLHSYRAFTDEPVAPWRESNDTVLRIGGWQAYGRESRDALRVAPMPQAPQPPRTGSKPGSAHDGHHGARK